MHPPPSSSLPARASSPLGDVVAGVKRTMKVWSIGLFAGIRGCGVFAWWSPSMSKPSRQDLGMRGPEVGKDQTKKKNNETRNGGVARMPFLAPFCFTLCMSQHMFAANVAALSWRHAPN